VNRTMTEMTAVRDQGGTAASGRDLPDKATERLVAGGWVLPTAVPGLLCHTTKFEAVLARLQAALTAVDPSASTGPAWYPPVAPRADIDRAQYAESFPHLLGSVHALAADAEPDGLDAPDDSARRPADVVLAPAVCYGVYPVLADSVIEEPVFFDAAGQCYRHEATSELGRYRSFRMREFVTVCDENAALLWRDSWIARCEKLFGDLGLTVSVEPASDPFFGPGGRFMKSSQIQQNLKFEFVMPVRADDPGTAVASANCHKEHLGERFAISFADQGWAHSSCMAFGLERTMLALIHAHGDTLADWPDALA
jgi:seryl-tRNA synthetase